MVEQPIEPTHPVRESETIGRRDLTDWPTRLGRRLVVAGVELGRRAPWVGRAYGWSTANLAFVVFAAVTLGVAVSLTKAAGEVYEAVTDHAGISLIDQPVLDAAVGLRSPGLDSAVTWFTDIGGPIGMPILAGLVMVALGLRWKSWTPVVVTLLAAVGAVLMTLVGKGVIGRARPPIALAVPPFESSPSFPSGHTLNATVLTAIVAYLVLLRTTTAWQRVLTLGVAGAFVLGMGLSRVFLGHHWLTDVLAGWLIGLAWSLAVITAHRLYLTLDRRPERVLAA